MPFISRDWRGPGEEWIKCQDGWEIRRMAVMENREEEIREGEGVVKRRRTKTEGDVADNKENMLIRLERHRSLPTLQPFCPIITKCTREVAGFNSLADVLKRLDFRSAVHDIRRFQYVSTILKLLLTPEKLYQLAGASQKLIFRILEEMAGTVFAEHMNEHVLLKLLSDLHATLDDRAVWGTHLGSETLMRGHKNARSRIACIAALEKKKSELELREKQEMEDETMSMEELPEECVREILCRLSDYRDVDNAGRATPTMQFIVKEKRIWRELVQAHFTKNEIQFIINKRPELAEKKSWRNLYVALRKHFGLRQQFTELLMLCKNCRVLFWESYGHPCLSSSEQCSTPIPITPQTFLTFFSV